MYRKQPINCNQGQRWCEAQCEWPLPLLHFSWPPGRTPQLFQYSLIPIDESPKGVQNRRSFGSYISREKHFYLRKGKIVSIKYLLSICNQHIPDWIDHLLLPLLPFLPLSFGFLLSRNKPRPSGSSSSPPRWPTKPATEMPLCFISTALAAYLHKSWDSLTRLPASTYLSSMNPRKYH